MGHECGDGEEQVRGKQSALRNALQLKRARDAERGYNGGTCPGLGTTADGKMASSAQQERLGARELAELQVCEYAHDTFFLAARAAHSAWAGNLRQRQQKRALEERAAAEKLAARGGATVRASLSVAADGRTTRSGWTGIRAWGYASGAARAGGGGSGPESGWEGGAGRDPAEDEFEAQMRVLRRETAPNHRLSPPALGLLSTFFECV